jgi:DNA-binding MarR family transcriptional regulator
MQQYNVLRILRGAGEGGLPTLAIADRMIERAPGITRLLDRMEVHGWACRLRCRKDRRVVYASITPQGRLLLDRIEGPLHTATLSGIPEVPHHDLRRFLDLLADVRQVTARPLVPDSNNQPGTR